MAALERLEMVPRLGKTNECGNFNIEPVLVKTVEQLEQVRGLIIPGGESTTIGKLLRRFGLREEIIKRAGAGKLAVWGTCAGAILLAKKITGKQQADSLELMDIVVERNAYGRQLESFEAEIEWEAGNSNNSMCGSQTLAASTAGGQFCLNNKMARSSNGGVRMRIPAVFIRAPRIMSVEKGAKILAYYRGGGPTDVCSEIRDGGEAVNVRNGVRDGGEIVAAREKNLLITTFHPELTEDLTLHRYFAEMCKEI